MKKCDIKEKLLKYFLDKNIFAEPNGWENKPKTFQFTSKEQFELSRLQIELEREKIQLKMKELDVGSSCKNNISFDISKYIKLVPPFQEHDVDRYFLHFEKIAKSLNWPEQYWTLLLQSVIKGKARDIYTQLSLEQSSSYELVKDFILKGYELVPEAYRQKFRNLKKGPGLSFIEFAREKEQLLDRWIYSMGINGDFDKLKQLILLEEFKKCVDPSIRLFLEEKQVVSLEVGAKLAEEYVLTHGSSVGAISSQNISLKNNSDSREYKGNSFPRINCNYCKKPGHIVSECFKLKNKQKIDEFKPFGFICNKFTKQFCGPSKCDGKPVSVSKSVLNAYQPFVSDGYVSKDKEGIVSSTPIKILRDTGASQSLILANALPCSKEISSETVTVIQGVSGELLTVPLLKLYLSSSLIEGYVMVGVIDSLPLPGIHLLLGNDLAGKKVLPNPVLSENSNLHSSEEESEGVYPACVVTRGMKRKNEQKLLSEVNLTDTCVGKLFQNDNSGEKLSSHSKSIDMNFNHSNRVEQQRGDPEIHQVINGALDEGEASKVPICYFTRNGVLMRKYRPPNMPTDSEWAVNNQILAPKFLQGQLLNLASDVPTAGHLGINKSYKILNHCYWPKLNSDVTEYCRSFPTCQMVGKPNQKIPKARLHPVPAIEEPFSRVLIDYVGPLPKSKMGNEYLLTIMCASTRFPEAIPLKSIKAKIIIKALSKFFAFVGYPKTVQSDQGSNFMSGVFQQMMNELGIKQIRSSAYHPESQGAIERFHQTLKNMIRSYCYEYRRVWDDGIHLLLFAIRESVPASLGFSPFELVFGHSVRGPLKIVKDKILSEQSTVTNLLQYVSDFKIKLNNACDLAGQNL